MRVVDLGLHPTMCGFSTGGPFATDLAGATGGQQGKHHLSRREAKSESSLTSTTNAPLALDLLASAPNHLTPLDGEAVAFTSLSAPSSRSGQPEPS